MHECPACGYACDCDIEDTWNPPPDDCSCPCEEEYYDADNDYDDDGRE